MTALLRGFLALCGVFQNEQVGVGDLDFLGDFALDGDIVFEDVTHEGAGGEVVLVEDGVQHVAEGFLLGFWEFGDGKDVGVLAHGCGFSWVCGFGFGRIVRFFGGRSCEGFVIEKQRDWRVEKNGK